MTLWTEERVGALMVCPTPTNTGDVLTLSLPASEVFDIGDDDSAVVFCGLDRREVAQLRDVLIEALA